MAKATYKVSHTILEATTDEEIIACFPVIKELRSHIPNETEALRLINIQREEEKFHFLYIKDIIDGESEPRPVSIISYRILHCLYYGRQLFINDLCTLSSAKRKGYAGALIDFVIDVAKKENCVATVNSAYVGRVDAHRLYLNKGFHLKSHHLCM